MASMGKDSEGHALTMWTSVLPPGDSPDWINFVEQFNKLPREERERRFQDAVKEAMALLESEVVYRSLCERNE